MSRRSAIVGWGLGLAAILVAGRGWILSRPPLMSDVFYYAEVALESELASREGVSVYDLRARMVRDELERRRADGLRIPSLEEHARVEYPPLAVLAMRLPAAWRVGASWPPRSLEAYARRYVAGYRAAMVATEAVLLAALVLLVRRLFPRERPGERAERLLAYLLSTLALWPLLYDRLDLVQAMLVEVALALLLAPVHYAWSFAALALGINFKLMPAVLAPIFVIGSMPAAAGLEPSGRTLRLLAVRAGLLAAMVLAVFLPFYAVDGRGCLDFLAYHRNRGIEVHALSGSLLLILGELGYPVHVYANHQCMNVGAPLAPFLTALAPRLMAASSLGLALLCWARFRGLARDDRPGADGSATLARLHPGEVVSYALAALLLCVVTNKVLSSQYLIWLAPVVPLLPWRPPARRLATGLFVASCVLTTVLFPYLFHSDLAPLSADGRIGPATHRAVAILAVRNLLLLGLAAGVSLHLWRSAMATAWGPAAEPAREQSPAAVPAVGGCP